MDYHTCSTREITDPDAVGCGTGDAPDGSLRICVALQGTKINVDTMGEDGWQEWDDQGGWHSLTPGCAVLLCDLLLTYHVFGYIRRAIPDEATEARDKIVAMSRTMSRVLGEVEAHMKTPEGIGGKPAEGDRLVRIMALLGKL